jgi:hypothetical protein
MKIDIVYLPSKKQRINVLTDLKLAVDKLRKLTVSKWFTAFKTALKLRKSDRLYKSAMKGL